MTKGKEWDFNVRPITSGIEYDRPANERDAPSKKRHTDPMNDITRDELSKTLSAIEERMDKRVERMEQSEERRAESWRREQDAYRKEQETRDKLYAERFEATSRRLEDRDKVIDSKLDGMNASLLSMGEKVDGFEGKLIAALDGVKASNKETSRHVTGVVIAAVFGFLAINATMIYGAKSFFDSGKEISGLQSTVESTKVLLQSIQAEREKQSQRPAEVAKPKTASPQPSSK